MFRGEILILTIKCISVISTESFQKQDSYFLKKIMGVAPQVLHVQQYSVQLSALHLSQKIFSLTTSIEKNSVNNVAKL